MIVVRLTGGIGNQMFQYAFGRCLMMEYRTDLILDLSFFESQELRKYELDIFGIQASFLTPKVSSIIFPSEKTSHIGKLTCKILNKIYRFKVVEEKSFSFNNVILKHPYNYYLNGYWQSEKYFLEYADLIKNDFKFKTEVDYKNKEISDIIYKSNSVSVHIRRGDFISNPFTNNVHGVCDIDYYNRAVSYINTKIKDPVFFIFSDDMEWAKKHFMSDKKKYFIDFNILDKSHNDLRLMSLCKNNIIANSSFSWWGAWLNSNKHKIVVAPQKWFNNSNKDTSDLIPISWVKM